MQLNLPFLLTRKYAKEKRRRKKLPHLNLICLLSQNLSSKVGSMVCLLPVWIICVLSKTSDVLYINCCQASYLVINKEISWELFRVYTRLLFSTPLPQMKGTACINHDFILRCPICTLNWKHRTVFYTYKCKLKGKEFD